jgi:hypothetical protein
MSEDKKYRLLWTAKAVPEGITKEEIAPGWGACDAALLCSVIYPEDGSFSMLLIPMDGRSKDAGGGPAVMDDLEMFKIWMMMSKRLSSSKTLSEARKSFARSVFKTFADALKREIEENGE